MDDGRALVVWDEQYAVPPSNVGLPAESVSLATFNSAFQFYGLQETPVSATGSCLFASFAVLSDRGFISKQLSTKGWRDATCQELSLVTDVQEQKRLIDSINREGPNGQKSVSQLFVDRVNQNKSAYASDIQDLVASVIFDDGVGTYANYLRLVAHPHCWADSCIFAYLLKAAGCKALVFEDGVQPVYRRWKTVKANDTRLVFLRHSNRNHFTPLTLEEGEIPGDFLKELLRVREAVFDAIENRVDIDACDEVETGHGRGKRKSTADSGTSSSGRPYTKSGKGAASKHLPRNDGDIATVVAVLQRQMDTVQSFHESVKSLHESVKLEAETLRQDKQSFNDEKREHRKDIREQRANLESARDDFYRFRTTAMQAFASSAPTPCRPRSADVSGTATPMPPPQRGGASAAACGVPAGGSTGADGVSNGAGGGGAMDHGV